MKEPDSRPPWTQTEAAPSLKIIGKGGDAVVGAAADMYSLGFSSPMDRSGAVRTVQAVERDADSMSRQTQTDPRSALTRQVERRSSFAVDQSCRTSSPKISALLKKTGGNLSAKVVAAVVKNTDSSCLQDRCYGEPLRV